MITLTPEQEKRFKESMDRLKTENHKLYLLMIQGLEKAKKGELTGNVAKSFIDKSAKLSGMSDELKESMQDFADKSNNIKFN